MMRLTGTKEEIAKRMLDICPVSKFVLDNSASIKGQLLQYQAMALYHLAANYGYSTATILEIGTLAGYSASIMAQAAPTATITTLNPKQWEVDTAAQNLDKYKNVHPVCAYSWDYLETYNGNQIDLIFVDGDHNRIARDLPWFEHLRDGGLMLFHDYSQEKSGIVYNVLNDTANKYDHPFDVYLMDTDGNGMVGFIKRDGEVWG